MQILTPIIIFILLSIVNYVPEIKMLIGQRVFTYGGEIEIVILTLYGAGLYYLLMNRSIIFDGLCTTINKIS